MKQPDFSKDFFATNTGKLITASDISKNIPVMI